MLRELRDADPYPETELGDDVEQDVAHNERAEDAVDDGGVFKENVGSGGDALDEERAHEHGGHVVAGDAEGQERDHSGTGHGVVGGFGSHDAFDGAFAELLGMFRGALGFGVGHVRGGGSPEAGHGADDRADDGRTEQDRDAALDFLPREAAVFAGKIELLFKGLADAGTGLMDDFGQAEQADDHRDEGDARHEVFVFEGEAHGPGGTGDAHGGEEDAHARAEDALEDGGARNAAHYGQGQQDKAALFDGADFEGEIGQGGGHADEQDVAERVPEHRADQRRVEALARFALLGEGVAVHSGADGRRRAGGVEEDGGDGAAEHAGLIDAEQHGDAHQRADVEGQRQEDGNGHDARNAGDGPEHEPREDAEGHGPDGFRSEDGNEPCTDVREHVASPVVGLAEQDAGRKDDLHEVERHVIE